MAVKGKGTPLTWPRKTRTFRLRDITVADTAHIGLGARTHAADDFQVFLDAILDQIHLPRVTHM